jgi:hypothetical protein
MRRDLCARTESIRHFAHVLLVLCLLHIVISAVIWLHHGRARCRPKATTLLLLLLKLLLLRRLLKLLLLSRITMHAPHLHAILRS